MFSAEDSDDSAFAATVSVKPGGVPITPNTSYVDASVREPSNWARVTVVDQYGAPIAGAKVVLEKKLGEVLSGRGSATGTLTWTDYTDRARPTVTYSLTVTGGCS